MGEKFSKNSRPDSVKGERVIFKKLNVLNILFFKQHDIREAPRNIIDSYKMYYKLKSSFLEDTLNDVLDEDGFDLSLEGSQLDTSASDRSQNCPSLPDFPIATASGCLAFSNVSEIGATSLSNLRNLDEKHVIKEFEAEVVNDDAVGSLNKDAWGASLNKVAKTNTSPAKTKPVSQEVRKSVTNKLFKNSSFSVRNPRKSLSRSNSTISTSISQQLAARDVLPDLESILVEKAKKQMEMENNEKIAKPEPAFGQTTPSLHIVDTKWLNRCNEANRLGNVEDGSCSVVSSQPVKYGLLNLNVNLNLVEKTGQVQSTPSLGLSSLTIDDQEPRSGQLETYAHPTYDNPHNEDDDDDEVIENSEDESTTADISSLRHIAKKRKIEDVKPKDPSPKTTPNPDVIVPITKPIEKLKKLPKKLSKRQTATPASPQPPTVSRRSTRNSTRVVTRETSSSEWDEVDSDNDPEFKLTKQDAKMELHEAMEDEKEEQEMVPRQKNEKMTKRKVPKEKKAKLIKPKSKVSAIKKLKAVPRKPHQNPRKTSINNKPEINDCDMEEDEEQPEDYLEELGSGNIQSVPRININELQASTQAFEDYVQASQLLPRPTSGKSIDHTKSTASYDTLEKRAKERTKIEKKIAAGTLNENFVRINIQKKVFSRGHKSVNFSRYKKNQWSKAKAASALAGPEMDMRGCDGGFLVCFQCGQQGHFQQDCKIQGEWNLHGNNFNI